ncbi:MAG: FecR family protein [Agriterribacter sp.]
MSASRIWELLLRKFNKEITGEELQELELLLQQQQDISEINEILLNLHRLPLEHITDDADIQKSREAIRFKIAEEQKEVLKVNDIIDSEATSFSLEKWYNKFKWEWRIAAIIAVLFCCVWLLKKEDLAPAIQSNEVVTTAGSKTAVNLPDGSSVILNSGSKLTYNKDFGVTAREIYLNGEGYFDIAKNEHLPLTVHAGNVDIKVKGTVFNVKAYTEDSTVEASLITGIIEVFSQSDPERKILLRPKEKILIGKYSAISSMPAEKSVTPRGEVIMQLGKIKANSTDSSINEIAWIQNKFVFTKESFLTLAQKMERWYNVSIVFRDKDLTSLTFTGSFEKEDIVEALDALRETAAFDYTIENRKVIIRKNK